MRCRPPQRVGQPLEQIPPNRSLDCVDDEASAGSASFVWVRDTLRLGGNFQMMGLCQILAGSGLIPPNRSLDCVDDEASAGSASFVWVRDTLRLGGNASAAEVGSAGAAGPASAAGAEQQAASPPAAPGPAVTAVADQPGLAAGPASAAEVGSAGAAGPASAAGAEQQAASPPAAPGPVGVRGVWGAGGLRPTQTNSTKKPALGLVDQRAALAPAGSP